MQLLGYFRLTNNVFIELAFHQMVSNEHLRTEKSLTNTGILSPSLY